MGTALLGALLPIVFQRVDAMIPDPKFTIEVSYFPTGLFGFLFMGPSLTPSFKFLNQIRDM